LLVVKARIEKKCARFQLRVAVHVAHSWRPINFSGRWQNPVASNNLIKAASHIFSNDSKGKTSCPSDIASALVKEILKVRQASKIFAG
jgi:hypothetical protein